MWIKICANTNLEDARAAIDAGADALGFIFAPSSRRISPRDAGRITAALGDRVEKVGVFMNQTPELILDTVEKAGLTAVQLHGNEDAALARELLRAAKRELKLFKAINLSGHENDPYTGAVIAALDNDAPQVFTAFLLDSSAQGKGGGTGEVFDWQTSAPWVRMVGKRSRIVIAGGLKPENVRAAIELFHPWGVDVVSGVEASRGKKDHAKLRAFVQAARAAEKAIAPAQSL